MSAPKAETPRPATTLCVDCHLPLHRLAGRQGWRSEGDVMRCATGGWHRPRNVAGPASPQANPRIDIWSTTEYKLARAMGAEPCKVGRQGIHRNGPCACEAAAGEAPPAACQHHRKSYQPAYNLFDPGKDWVCRDCGLRLP